MWNPFKRKTIANEFSADQPVWTVDPRTFAWSMFRLRLEKKQPFDAETMQIATSGIPSKWHGLFEFAVEANQYAELFEMFSSGRIGPQTALHLLAVTGGYFEEEGPAHAHLASMFVTMFMSEPLPADHPVFTSAECLPFIPQRRIFGRAWAAMQSIQMTDDDRLWAIGQLGRRLVRATEIARRSFAPVVERIHFVETEEEMVKAAQSSAK